MKQNKKGRRLQTEKITKKQILIFSRGEGEPIQGSGCGIKRNRKPAMHLRSRQCMSG